jgi:hypothetical protein
MEERRQGFAKAVTDMFGFAAKRECSNKIIAMPKFPSEFGIGP